MNPYVERRGNPRYTVKSEVLAVLKPYPVKLGQIANISEGGLAFMYLGENRISEPYTHMDLYDAKGEKTCHALPIELVSFAEIAYIYGIIPIQRVSIRFRDLTGHQKDAIKGFIQAYTE